MRVEQLVKHGIPERIIDIWMKSGTKNLLPIQEKAVTYGKILDGKNALILAPTSSGKTFVGEMAAISTAMKMKRVIYLAPQKALVEEKFREFQDRYSQLGIRVVISS